MNEARYFTYSEWVTVTVDKIVAALKHTHEKDREDYLRVQIKAAIEKARRHGRSGLSDDDPVTP